MEKAIVSHHRYYPYELGSFVPCNLGNISSLEQQFSTLLLVQETSLWTALICSSHLLPMSLEYYSSRGLRDD